jgi:hypothetical protein
VHFGLSRPFDVPPVSRRASIATRWIAAASSVWLASALLWTVSPPVVFLRVRSMLVWPRSTPPLWSQKTSGAGAPLEQHHPVTVEP